MLLPSVYAYIPAYNASKTIRQLIADLDAVLSSLKSKNLIANYEIFVVDDGSTDNTKQILSNLESEMKSLNYISFKRNMGVVNAILKALERISSRAKNEDILLRIDSDYEHNPSDIPALISPLLNHSAAACVGYLNPDIRNGLLFSLLNYFIGGMEHRQFFGKWIPQFCPGFVAFNAGSIKPHIPQIKKDYAAYKKQFDADMIHLDVLCELYAAQHGKIRFLKIAKTKEQYAQSKPLSKSLRYFSDHNNFLSFIKNKNWQHV